MASAISAYECPNTPASPLIIARQVLPAILKYVVLIAVFSVVISGLALPALFEAANIGNNLRPQALKIEPRTVICLPAYAKYIPSHWCKVLRKQVA